MPATQHRSMRKMWRSAGGVGKPRRHDASPGSSPPPHRFLRVLGWCGRPRPPPNNNIFTIISLYEPRAYANHRACAPALPGSLLTPPGRFYWQRSTRSLVQTPERHLPNPNLPPLSNHSASHSTTTRRRKTCVPPPPIPAGFVMRCDVLPSWVVSSKGPLWMTNWSLALLPG